MSKLRQFATENLGSGLGTTSALNSSHNTFFYCCNMSSSSSTHAPEPSSVRSQMRTADYVSLIQVVTCLLSCRTRTDIIGMKMTVAHPPDRPLRHPLPTVRYSAPPIRSFPPPPGSHSSVAGEDLEDAVQLSLAGSISVSASEGHPLSELRLKSRHELSSLVERRRPQTQCQLCVFSQALSF
ncbi:hypothetical protein BT69DRAFT_1278557 [Atractiella rhizophila]|nr:hypothetical protein BT69DRAFT_1278557 [Atractiella rhizophila]